MDNNEDTVADYEEEDHAESDMNLSTYLLLPSRVVHWVTSHFGLTCLGSFEGFY